MTTGTRAGGYCAPALPSWSLPDRRFGPRSELHRALRGTPRVGVGGSIMRAARGLLNRRPLSSFARAKALSSFHDRPASWHRFELPGQ